MRKIIIIETSINTILFIYNNVIQLTLIIPRDMLLRHKAQQNTRKISHHGALFAQIFAYLVLSLEQIKRSDYVEHLTDSMLPKTESSPNQQL